MEVTRLISRVRSEIGDQPTPFMAQVEGDGQQVQFDLVQPNLCRVGFQVTVINGASTTVLSSPADYTADDETGIVTFTSPLAYGAKAIIQGTSYGMFSDPALLHHIRDSVTWHCHNRSISERYRDRHGFITYRENPVNLQNLPPEEELPLITLCTMNIYWALADDAALDVNVQTAEGTQIDRTARYNQVMRQIQALDARYKELCAAFNIGPYRMETLNLRRTSQTTGRLIPLMQPREYDDRRYPVRMLPPIDSRYADNSGVPSQIFYGAGL
jgi:hypothetical protein